jgi:hypothetical protein
MGALLLAGVSAFAAEETPAQVVTRVYRDFAWEAVIEEPVAAGKTLAEQPRDVLIRYLDDALTALILEDRACVRRTGEICRLDFVPIWGSQDPAGASGLHVSTARDAPDVVSVRFRYPNGEVAKLTFRMARTARGWRIADIAYGSSPSLVTVLTVPQQNPHE